MIRQLQARQAELEAENDALRQACVTRVDAQMQPGNANTAPPPITNLEEGAQRHALRERVKELRCLYDIGALLNRSDLSQDELAQEIVDCLPTAYQFPEVTCASLTIDDRRFSTANYADTPWQLTGIVRDGKPARYTLTVGYLEERPAADEGPFIKEERSLINEVCAQLGHAMERRRLHRALAASECRFRALIENSSDGILLVGTDRHLRYASPSAARILGYEPEELMQPGALAIHPEDLEAIAAGWQQTYAMPARTVNQSGRARHADGSWRWIEATVTNLLSDPAVEAVVVNFRDVTERRSAEIELAASEERYRRLAEELEERVAERTAEVHDLYENAPYGYHTIDAAGVITRVNRTELEMLGYTREEMVGHPAREFLTPDGLEVYLASYPKLIAKGTLSDLEFELRRKDGTTLPVTMTATASYDAAGHFVKSRGSIFDISQRRRSQQALQASEARLNFLLTHTPAIIYAAALTDHGTTTTFLSESTYRLLGYTPAEHRDDPGFWNSLVHPDDVDSGLECVQELLTSGSATWEHRVRHGNGTYRWHTTGMSRLQTAAEPPQFIGYSVDIHESKLARDAQRISEARFRSVLQNAPANITEVDRNGTILSQNRTILGRPVDTVIGRTLFDIAPPNAAPDIRNALHAVFEEGRSVHYESSIEVPPGDVRYFVSYAGPIDDGRIDAAVVVTLDITDLKKAEAELQRQRDFAQQVMDAMGEGLVVGDRHQRAEYVNPRMAHLLESTQAELLGGVLTDFVPAEDLPGVVKMLVEHLPGERQQYEMRVRTLSGAIVPTLVSSSPRWENGELAGRIAVFTDLTRIKQIESDLRRSSDELRAANVALEKAMQMKDEFLASMSHELRTPLTGILGLSESLQLQTFGALKERQYRAVQYIWESGQHLLDLINDILDLSKLAADQLDLELETCDVDTICRASLTLVKGMAGKKNQQLSYELENRGIAVRADSRRLKQMLVNLLSNAVKFTPEEGELGLRVRGDSIRRIVEFHVWDRGTGIDAVDLPRLFQPFTQLDSSLTREHPGSGLGLALAHRMAQLHGGTIEVASKPGAGSTFTLLLPMDEPEPQSEPNDWTPPSAIPGPSRIDTHATGDTGGPHLLVAEDDPINSDILHELLTAQGYRVTLAANGRELLRIAPNFAPALIIMDVRMPQMDGLEATRRLRADPDPSLANVPIIMLTAQAMEGDAECCLAAGANHYIAKPYAAASLLAAIETLLNTENGSS